MFSSFFPHFCVSTWLCKSHKSSIKPPLSNKLPLFSSWKLISPPLPSPPSYYCSPINYSLYWSITTVKLHLDWSRMVFSPAGSSDLFFKFGCMTSNFLYLSFPLCILVLHRELIQSSLLNKIRHPPSHSPLTQMSPWFLLSSPQMCLK